MRIMIIAAALIEGIALFALVIAFQMAGIVDKEMLNKSISSHSMMQQMRDAAVSQGLLAPPACPYTGLAAGGVAAMPVWPAM